MDSGDTDFQNIISIENNDELMDFLKNNFISKVDNINEQIKGMKKIFDFLINKFTEKTNKNTIDSCVIKKISVFKKIPEENSGKPEKRTFTLMTNSENKVNKSFTLITSKRFISKSPLIKNLTKLPNFKYSSNSNSESLNIPKIKSKNMTELIHKNVNESNHGIFPHKIKSHIKKDKINIDGDENSNLFLLEDINNDKLELSENNFGNTINNNNCEMQQISKNSRYGHILKKISNGRAESKKTNVNNQNKIYITGNKINNLNNSLKNKIILKDYGKRNDFENLNHNDNAKHFNKKQNYKKGEKIKSSPKINNFSTILSEVHNSKYENSKSNSFFNMKKSSISIIKPSINNKRLFKLNDHSIENLRNYIKSPLSKINIENSNSDCISRNNNFFPQNETQENNPDLKNIVNQANLNQKNFINENKKYQIKNNMSEKIPITNPNDNFLMKDNLNDSQINSDSFLSGYGEKQSNESSNENNLNLNKKQNKMFQDKKGYMKTTEKNNNIDENNFIRILKKNKTEMIDVRKFSILDIQGNEEIIDIKEYIDENKKDENQIDKKKRNNHNLKSDSDHPENLKNDIFFNENGNIFSPERKKFDSINYFQGNKDKIDKNVNLRRIFYPSLTAQCTLNFLTESKISSNIISLQNHPIEVINIFKILYILSNEKYEEIEENDIIKNFFYKILKNSGIDNIRNFIFQIICKHINEFKFNNSQLECLKKLIEDNPNLLDVKAISEINKTLSLIIFILKEIISFIYKHFFMIRFFRYDDFSRNCKFMDIIY